MQIESHLILSRCPCAPAIRAPGIPGSTCTVIKSRAVRARLALHSPNELGTCASIAGLVCLCRTEVLRANVDDLLPSACARVTRTSQPSPSCWVCDEIYSTSGPKRDRPPSLRSREDLAVRQKIQGVHQQHLKIPGGLKYWRLLSDQGVACGVEARRKARFRVMRTHQKTEPPALDLVKRAFARRYVQDGLIRARQCAHCARVRAW